MSEPVELMKPFSESRAVSPSRKLYLYWRKIVPPKLRTVCWNVLERLSAARLKYTSITRHEFIKDIEEAIAGGRGYAAAKIGISQKYWMYYELFLSKGRDPGKIREYEKQLKFHASNQEGIFPATRDFYLEFNRFYMNHVKNLNCLGLFYQPASMEMELIRYYRLKNKFIYLYLKNLVEPMRGVTCRTLGTKRCC